MSRLYGIRGATTVEANEKEAILREAARLMKELIEANGLKEDNVVSVIFTTTPDLTAEFPAKACREMGWAETALLGAVEADVPHGILRCIRVLIHAYLEEGMKPRPVYLNDAVKLRPDLVQEKDSS
ncbi:MAG: chorismate mutase [Peptococcaceae bacterium]|jgi:chorismate mutase|nr:chorismate mutase [Peptococcaceae bacterium]MDH7525936.1 chorismate mutase [Peptococcaceae bacterium]